MVTIVRAKSVFSRLFFIFIKEEERLLLSHRVFFLYSSALSFLKIYSTGLGQNFDRGLVVFCLFSFTTKNTEFKTLTVFQPT